MCISLRSYQNVLMWERFGIAFLHLCVLREKRSFSSCIWPGGINSHTPYALFVLETTILHPNRVFLVSTQHVINIKINTNLH